jgi:hypothetical protein
MRIFRKRNPETPENTPKLPIMKAATLALLRHLLTFIGGALVAKGFIDTESLQEIIGAIITMLSIGWMTVEKSKAAPKP